MDNYMCPDKSPNNNTHTGSPGEKAAMRNSPSPIAGYAGEQKAYDAPGMTGAKSTPKPPTRDGFKVTTVMIKTATSAEKDAD